MRSLVSNHWPAAIWSLIVAFLLLSPGGSDGPTPEWLQWLSDHGSDKVVHALLFFIQASVLARSLRRVGSSAGSWTPVALAALYGLVLEVAQMGIAGRGWEVTDVAANTAGALLWRWVQRVPDERS